MVWSWGEVLAGLLLVGCGWVMATARVVPGPAWLWGRYYLVDSAPTAAGRTIGRSQIALGAGMVSMGLGMALAPAGYVAAVAVGTLFAGWSCVLGVRARRLSRAQ